MLPISTSEIFILIPNLSQSSVWHNFLIFGSKEYEVEVFEYEVLVNIQVTFYFLFLLSQTIW